MNKECVCGKVLPYQTEEDIRFYTLYHSNCTDNLDILDLPMVY